MNRLSSAARVPSLVAAALISLFSMVRATVPVITGVEHQTISSGTSQALDGSGLSSVTSVALISRNLPYPATFQGVSDTRLNFTMPSIPIGRDSFLMARTADHAVLAFDPQAPICKVVKSGETFSLPGPSGLELVYVKAGGKLTFTGGTSDLALYAEAGAEVDWTGHTSSTLCSLTYTPATVFTGTLPSPLSVRRIQVPALSSSSAIGGFRLGYPLPIAITGNGTVTRTPDRPYYATGESIMLQATPGSGSVFEQWTGVPNSNGPSYTAIMGTSTPSIGAIFAAVPQWSLALNAGPGGTLTASPAKALYGTGEIVTLTATPDPLHAVNAWNGDTTGGGSTKTLTMDGHKSASVTFTRVGTTVPLDVISVDHQVIPKGQQVTVSGSGFSQVTGAGFQSIYGFTSTPFQIVDDSTLRVTMPANAVDTRDYHLVLRTAVGDVPVLDPTDPRVKVVYPGQTLTVSSSDFYQIIYALQGSVVEVEDFMMSEALYAEAGSIIDLSGEPFIDLTAFVYTPGTAILGPVPTTQFGASVRQVPSIALDPSAGFFRSGYPIHFTVVGNGGIESIPSTTYFPAFEWVSLTAVPGAGSYFQGWSGALASSNPTDEVRVENAALNITATFADGWTLTAHASVGGTVVASPAKATYLPGESVTLTAIPAPGREFAGWGLDASGTSPSVTVTMNGNKTVSAVFRSTAATMGPIIHSADHFVAAEGAPIKLSGSGFQGVTSVRFMGGGPAPVPAAFEEIDTSSLRVIFPDIWSEHLTHQVLLETTGGSTIGLDSADASVRILASGTTASIGSSSIERIVHVRAGALLRLQGNLTGVCVFAENGAIVDWSGVSAAFDCDFVHSPETIVLGNPAGLSGGGFPLGEGGLRVRLVTPLSVSTLGAGFQVGQPIHFTIVGNGRVTTDPATTYIPIFTWVNLSAIAGPDACFQGWSGDLVSSDAAAQVRVENEPLHITATFADGWSLTTHASAGGSVAVSPAKNAYAPGETVTLTATPAPGREFAGWGLDASGTELSTTVTMNANRTVSAIFRDPAAIPGPRITAADHMIVAEGETITLTGSGLDELVAVRFLGVLGAVDATFVPAGPISLAVTMPDFDREFWAHHLLLEGTRGSTIGLDSTSSDVRIVENGQFESIDELDLISCVYVKAGALLRLHGNLTGLAVFAEEGAIVDWSGVSAAFDCDFIHSPETIVLGEPEELGEGGLFGSDGLSILQVAPLSLSSPVGEFRVGYPLELSSMGPGQVSALPDRARYAWGEVVTLTAVADPGMYFIRWSGDAAGRNASTTVHIGGPSTAIARFSAQSLTFGSWLLSHFTPQELANPSISGPGADPDGDQYSNSAEYAFSTDPRANSGTNPVRISTRANPENVEHPVSILLSYVRPSSAGDVSYTVKVSTDGNAWHHNGDDDDVTYSVERGVEDLGEGLEEVTVELYPDSPLPPSQLVLIDTQVF